MFIRFDKDIINLKMIEVVTFEENFIFIGMVSGEPIFLDLKHADKLEHAIIHFNEQGGYARP